MTGVAGFVSFMVAFLGFRKLVKMRKVGLSHSTNSPKPRRPWIPLPLRRRSQEGWFWRSLTWIHLPVFYSEPVHYRVCHGGTTYLTLLTWSCIIMKQTQYMCDFIPTWSGTTLVSYRNGLWARVYTCLQPWLVVYDWLYYMRGDEYKRDRSHSTHSGLILHTQQVTGKQSPSWISNHHTRYARGQLALPRGTIINSRILQRVS